MQWHGDGCSPCPTALPHGQRDGNVPGVQGDVCRPPGCTQPLRAPSPLQSSRLLQAEAGCVLRATLKRRVSPLGAGAGGMGPCGTCPGGTRTCRAEPGADFPEPWGCPRAPRHLRPHQASTLPGQPCPAPSSHTPSP